MKIECRPTKASRVAAFVVGVVCSLIAVACVVGSFYDTPRNLNGWLLIAVLTLCYGAVGLLLLAYCFRSLIVADEDGLLWRTTLVGWKSAKWEEVSDFYLLKERQKDVRIVETSQGKLRIGLDYVAVKNGEQSRIVETLNRLILEKASGVKASIHHSSEVEEWPARFVYFTDHHKNSAGQTALIAAAITAIQAYFFVRYLFALRADSVQREIFNQTPLLLNIAMALLFASPAILYVWLALFLKREQREALEHRDEFIEISPAGILFKGEEENSATWNQISSISQDASTGALQVVTDTGVCEIHRNLVNFLALSRLLEKWLPHLAIDWKDDEGLKGEKSHWSGGKIGEGAQIFHYRHSTSRLMLIGWAVILLASFAPFLLLPADWFGEESASKMSPGSVLFVGGIGTLVLIYGCLLYLRNEVWADETGLRFRSVFGEKRVSWDEIENYGADHNGHFVRVKGRRIQFTGGILLVGIHVLERLISSRSINAYGNWEEDVTGNSQKK